MLDLIGVGARIAEARRDAGKQQPEFAIELGTSLRSLAGYERGEREPPAGLLAALYEVAGVNPSWVLLGPKKAPKRQGTPIALAKATALDLYARLASIKKDLPPDVFADVFEILLEHATEKDAVDPDYTKKILGLKLKE